MIVKHQTQALLTGSRVLNTDSPDQLTSIQPDSLVRGACESVKSSTQCVFKPAVSQVITWVLGEWPLLIALQYPTPAESHWPQAP